MVSPRRPALHLDKMSSAHLQRDNQSYDCFKRTVSMGIISTKKHCRKTYSYRA